MSGNNGGSTLGSKLLLAGVIITGVALLVLFAFTFFALAVVLVPFLLVFLVLRKILPRGRKSAPAPEERTAGRSEIKDIIDITEYKEEEEMKILKSRDEDDT